MGQTTGIDAAALEIASKMQVPQWEGDPHLAGLIERAHALHDIDAIEALVEFGASSAHKQKRLQKYLVWLLRAGYSFGYSRGSRSSTAKGSSK